MAGVTWLAFRRRRTSLAVFIAVALVLDAWMLANGHASADALRHTGLCPTLPCVEPSEIYAPARQAAVIDLLLVVLPLALGLVHGVGLVAREAENSTHRLVFTQGVSRTRWYLTSLAVALGGALVVEAIVLPVAHWWAGIAWVDLPGTLTLGGSRIQPDVVPVSGVVPLAYTGFAVALGVAAGAVLRRVPWATAVTAVTYLVVAAVRITSIRPLFAPTGFLMDGTTDSAQYAIWPNPPPWNITYEYRAVPGIERSPGASSPDRVAAECSVYGLHPQDVVTCMRRQGVEGGFVTQSLANYWRLQWSETALYAVLALVLAGLGLVAVRRSRDGGDRPGDTIPGTPPQVADGSRYTSAPASRNSADFSLRPISTAVARSMPLPSA